MSTSGQHWYGEGGGVRDTSLLLSVISRTLVMGSIEHLEFFTDMAGQYANAAVCFNFL